MFGKLRRKIGLGSGTKIVYRSLTKTSKIVVKMYCISYQISQVH